MRTQGLLPLLLLALALAAPSAPATLPAGVLDATQAPYLADPTGRRDSTAGLQAAFRAGAASRHTVLIPAGRYRVTDTLNCSIAWPFLTANLTDPGPPTPDWLYAAHVIVGARAPQTDAFPTPGTTAQRPTVLFVPANTPGFTDRSVAKYVVHLLHTGVPPAYAQPDININQVLQGLDIEIGAGNFGAVGVMHLGAQGSSIEDVTVWAGEDAAVGIAGGAGGGGSHANVRVVGGRFGLDLHTSQPAPTVTGATLTNQTCASIVYHGRGPLSLVGARIQRLRPSHPDCPAALAAGLPPHAFTGGCTLPTPPAGETEHDAVPVFGGSVSVLDTVFEQPTSGPTAHPAIASNASVFLRNVYTRGYATIAAVGPLPPLAPSGSPGGLWTRVPEYAASQAPGPFHYYKANLTFPITSPIYAHGGVPQPGPWLPSPLVESAAPPPSDLQGRHLWDEPAFPSFQAEGAVDARTACGAVGDGVADDHAALQRCVDAHDVVVLPLGFYRLSQTLELRRPHGALVGVGRTSSVLMAATTGLADPGAPLLRVTGNGTTLFQLQYNTFWHLAGTWLLDWQAPTGVWRQAHGYRTCDVTAIHPQPVIGPSCAGFPRRDRAVALDRPLSVVSGGGRFFTFYIEDWHFQGPNYRHLLVNGSHSGASFYHINNDCALGDAAVEVAASSGVRLYGMKAEGNYCQLWVRRSTDVVFTGFGGFASPFPANASYPAGHQQYAPSMIRVEQSTNTTLANLWGNVRIGPVSPSGFGGQGIDPRLWSFLLWHNSTGPSEPHRLLPPLSRPVLVRL